MATSEDNLQMSLLNDYLNVYSEKLVLPLNTTAGAGIKLDTENFLEVVRDGKSGNPYTRYFALKAATNALQNEQKETIARLKADPANKGEEEKDLAIKLKAVTLEAEKKAHSKGVKNYVKGLSINKFSRYASVMSQIVDHKQPVQITRERLTQSQGQCRRKNCLEKASSYGWPVGATGEFTLS